MAGDRSLGELLYVLTRTVAPEIVIETGVATGVSSAYILAALADNRAGHLHSIDLPEAELVARGLVGSAVPAELRSRWSYHWGASKRLLPSLLRRTAVGRRIFLHDSDHSYETMRWELEQACRELGPGDVLVADDVDLHGAFAEIADITGSEATYISQASKPSVTGVMVKDHADYTFP